MALEDRFFCAALSRGHHEFLYGTAPRTRSWVLLEYAGAWKQDAIGGSDLPDQLKSNLEDLGKGSRAQLVRQSHLRSAPVNCFSVSTRESGSEISRTCFPSYADLSSVDLRTLQNHASAHVSGRPLYLVCTHGNHDKCCSKFGLPVYEAIRELTGADAWQCSHVGGDRFAANLICFPQGIYYGHVSVADARKIVQAQQRGEIYLKNYRGRCCYTRNVQVADYFVRRETGKLGFEDFRLLQAQPGVVRFASEDGVHEVMFQSREAFSEVLTCHSDGPRPVMQHQLVSHRIL